MRWGSDANRRNMARSSWPTGRSRIDVIVGPYAAAMVTGDVEPIPRRRPPGDGTEGQILTGLLDFLRATVVNKVAGLTDEQAFRTPVSPSTLTPAGLVKHLTGVERF